MDPSRRPGTDPDLLQLIGAAAELLGIGEHFQRLLPVDRWRAQRRHSRIERLRRNLLEHLEDARAGLRVVTSTVSRRVDSRGPADFAINIPASELPVLRRGLDQLQVSIRAMTQDTYELETVMSFLPDEVRRYYKMSEGGRSMLNAIRGAFDENGEKTQQLLESVERYLVRCAEFLSEEES